RECDRMRMHLLQILNLYTWYGEQVLFDPQVGLPYDLNPRILNERIISQQTARDAILDGHHPVIDLPVVFHVFDDLIKGMATDDFHRTTFVIRGRNVMKSSGKPLY